MIYWILLFANAGFALKFIEVDPGVSFVCAGAMLSLALSLYFKPEDKKEGDKLDDSHSE